MPTDLAAHVAIVREGRILLTKRHDFEVWVLPGGEVDPDESVAQAAVREARKETGLEVELTRLVGIYSMPGWPRGGHHSALFAARPIGGELRAQAGEVIDVRYFDPGALPEPLVWWHRQRIRDALAGVGGSVAWSQNAPWPFQPDTSRRKLYELAARSGLSKQEFFLRHFPEPAGQRSGLEVLEVGEGV